LKKEKGEIAKQWIATFQISGRRFAPPDKSGLGCVFTAPLEHILSKILKPNNCNFIRKIATLRYQFCDMTSFKYGCWGLWERWRSEPMV